MKLFPKNKIEYVGSDFTIHGLVKQSENGKKLDKKCVLINDLTLLLDSKADRTKARLVDAFAELASEGRYIYSARALTLSGKRYLRTVQKIRTMPTKFLKK
ncbi:hypothetical protein MUP01_13085 [Candidatus Bathyarchaeota archaeon]|nr:hypothetical protein [Candidatus Bathyarchaeota archaeon]